MKHENAIHMLRCVNDDIGDSFIITTADGKLIVVDGGYSVETAHFLRYLWRLTGRARPHIDAWFLTHPHDDHVEVFLDAASRGADAVEFDKVYFNFPEPSFYEGIDSWAVNILKRFYALEPGFADRTTILHDGDVLRIGQATITVLYAFDPAFQNCNESSLVFRLELGGKSVLFTGDCEENACRKILADPEKRALLACDICKMSHHGQNGATRAFYEAASPEICLWPTPAWVWDNRNGNLHTFETREWVDALGVKKHYVSMNGDRVIPLDEDGAVRQTPGLNPFLPFGTYIPDGEPKVFGGRVYLYGSYDLFGGGYCSREYHAVSAPVDDLTAWTDHGVSFRTEDVPWSDALLYAPDALYRNGKYYLFFCLSDGSEGVAESDRPEGPFTNARRVTLDGEPVSGIDPSVLEDGGRVYYTWGQFELRVGELADDLCTLKPGSVRTGALSNGDGREGFHEGSSLRKLGDKYCLVYASEYDAAYPHHGARPTKLDYAVGDSPYGPFLRRGTVIDNEGLDPASWNDHGSIVKIGEDWYVFYHASSDNCAFSRRARAEKLAVDETACAIRQARPTTNGFVPTLFPSQITSPVNACRFTGGAYATERGGRFLCAGIRDGAGFDFSPVHFEAGRYRLTLLCEANRETTARLYLGASCAGETTLPADGERQAVSLSFRADAGDAPVRLRFYGAADDALCEVEALELTIEPERIAAK